MNILIDKDSYSVADVSEMTGLCNKSLCYFLSDGIISAQKVSNDWSFSKSDVENLLDNPYVIAAIKLKENATLVDLKRDEENNTFTASLLVDRNIADEANEVLSQKFSELHQKNKAINIKYERQNDNVRIILSGPGDMVKKVYMSL